MGFTSPLGDNTQADTPYIDTPIPRNRAKGPLNGTGALTGGGALSGSGILSVGGSPGGEGSFTGGDSFLGVGDSPGGGESPGGWGDTVMALGHMTEDNEEPQNGSNDYDHDVPIYLQPSDDDGDVDKNDNVKNQEDEEKGEDKVGTGLLTGKPTGVPAGLGNGFGPIFRPGFTPGSGLELDDHDEGVGEVTAMESYAVEESRDYDEGPIGNDEGSLTTKNEIWFKTSLLPRPSAQKRQTKTDNLLQFLSRPSSAHHLQKHHDRPFVEDQRGDAVVAQEQQELLQMQEELFKQLPSPSFQGRAKRAQSAGSSESSRLKGSGSARLKSAPSKRPQTAVETGIGVELGQEVGNETELETGIRIGPWLEPELQPGSPLGVETTSNNNDWFASLENEVVPGYKPIPPTDT